MSIVTITSVEYLTDNKIVVYLNNNGKKDRRVLQQVAGHRFVGTYTIRKGRPLYVLCYPGVEFIPRQQPSEDYDDENTLRLMLASMSMEGCNIAIHDLVNMENITNPHDTALRDNIMASEVDTCEWEDLRQIRLPLPDENDIYNNNSQPWGISGDEEERIIRIGELPFGEG